MIVKKFTIEKVENIGKALSRLTAENVSIEFNDDLASFQKGDQIQVSLMHNPTEKYVNDIPSDSYAMVGQVVSNKEYDESGIFLSFGGILSNFAIPYDERKDFQELDEVCLSISAK